jgi:hypothetical protein
MQEKITNMKKITNNRTIVIISFVALIYCLSILIEKRITPNSGFDFKLWSPYYIIYAVFIPLVILLPIIFSPTSRYAKFVLQKENKINKVIVISSFIVMIWLFLWYAMIGIGNLMNSSLKSSEAETAALTSVKNDSIINAKIGLVDSIELVSNSISSKTANFDYILHGKDSTLKIEILLSHDQKWIVDTIIIK